MHPGMCADVPEDVSMINYIVVNLTYVVMVPTYASMATGGGAGAGGGARAGCT